MPTLNQLGKGLRIGKVRRNTSPYLLNGPQRKASIVKIMIVSPRKPNSARRTVAKVLIKKNEQHTYVKIPGIGPHGLQPHSTVKFRGHGPKDTPGINYQLIRGAYDLTEKESFGRTKRRSKFGLKIKDIIKKDDKFSE